MTDSSEEQERRKSFRLDMEKELVDIVWIDKSGQEHNKKIACLDFARGGLRLDCDQSLATNTAVTVVFKSANASNQKLYGKVLRSVKQESGWFEIALVLDKGA
ncbi:PilZ domain-containing protein [Colwellia psychrerythraea]|uniref:Type IV pilus assembly PilZ n=1 Tax=Colwellia psychrerythraea TaxID=28229 RepID=A0A099L4W6_COLPS|nr:PilZ domain-containing protein [Colwellia psychrerythraea]KGJ97475.1 type IV pilus assembly PilZ [Colwellia psychrerythraea]